MKKIARVFSAALALTLFLVLLPCFGMTAYAEAKEITQDTPVDTVVNAGDYILNDISVAHYRVIHLYHYGDYNDTGSSNYYRRITVISGGTTEWVADQQYVLKYVHLMSPTGAGTYDDILYFLEELPVPVAGVTLNKTSANLAVGDTLSLTATVAPTNATNKTVTWSSSNPLVATVSDDGVVTAVGAGEAIITATATNGTTDTSDDQTATCTVTVNKKNQTVTAPAANTGLVYTGSPQTLVTAATVTAGNTASGSISYSLDNASWSTSLPQGTNAGNYTVYYKVAGNDNYNEFVCSAPVSVTIAKADPETPTGLAATFGQTLADVTLPEGWTWADSSQSVGTAGENTFKANFAGNDNYNSASNVDVTVTVAKADPETPTGLTVIVGQTLADVTLPEGWTWADSSQSVGAAGENTFKANFAGNDNYNSASNVDVTVTVSTIAVTGVTGVTLDKTSLTLNEGDDPVTLTATVTPSNATNKGVTWSVAPEGVVTVADGVVTAVAPGTATVTVTTDDGGKTATCAVTVNPVINNAGGGKTHRIKKDGALYFTFVYVGHDADTYQAFVDADKVVTVSGENYTKQLKEGTEFKAKSGSLKLTLTRNYLDSLKPGDYTVTAKFRINGSVYESSSTFKMASSDGNNPGTGEDMMLIGAAMILFILSLSVLAYMAYTDKLFRAKLLAVPAGITSFFTRSDADLNEKKDGSEDNEA